MYGLPQTRKRVYIFGTHESVGAQKHIALIKELLIGIFPLGYQTRCTMPDIHHLLECDPAVELILPLPSKDTVKISKIRLEEGRLRVGHGLASWLIWERCRD